MAVTVGEIPFWPVLPDKLAALLDKIEAEREDSPRHPRPWDLASLPDPLQKPIRAWLLQAVDWMNACCAWQPETVIPACWPQHPHLALELAILAFARELAARDTRPSELRHWLDDLQTFQLRMRGALGEAGLKDCQRGTHAAAPGAYELARYRQQREAKTASCR